MASTVVAAEVEEGAALILPMAETAELRRELSALGSGWSSRATRLRALLGSSAALLVLILCAFATRAHDNKPEPGPLSLQRTGPSDGNHLISKSSPLALQNAAGSNSGGFGGFAPPEASGSSSLVPRETVGDGNKCNDDEEMHVGLCYDKCSLLTMGAYPFRQSAWTCCKKKECQRNPFLMFSCCKHDLGWCSGYDIAGMKEGNKVCPHQPGACLTNEELFLNMCYKSCSLMTKGEFPHRVGMATCCKRNDPLCVIADGAKLKFGLHGESLTKPAFNTGGGCDDDDETTPCSAHPPLSKLTR